MNFEKIVITGGSRGIGRAFVDQFINHASEIHVISRNFHDQPPNSNLFFHPLDLSKSKKIPAFIDNLVKEYGVPDLLINNAGSGAFYEWSEFPDAEILKQINLLFLVPVLFCQKLVPAMAKEGSGMVVNISSLAALYPVPNMPLYNASKSALSSFTTSMMLEYENPKFMDVILGDVKTEFNQQAAQGDITRYNRKTQNTWNRVRKQLDNSPNAWDVVGDLTRQINKRKSRVIYGGGFFHKTIFPVFHRFLSKSLLIKILQKYYGIQ